jgi:hypothetical protein
MSEENIQIEKQEPERERAGDSRWLMKNSKGERSITLTMTWISFCLVSCLYVLNAFESIHGIKLKNFDTAATGVYFSSILAAYVGRRYTDKDIK